MRKEFVLALALVGMRTDAGRGARQAAPAPPAPPAASSGSRQVPLKVQLTLSRFMGEKKISRAAVHAGRLVERAEDQPPHGRPGAGRDDRIRFEGRWRCVHPQSSYSYRDVGTNIDCQAQDAGNGLFSLVMLIEDSSIQLDKSPDSADEKKIMRDVPAFRSFRASFSMVLRDGQTMQYASATDPISGEVMRIDVTLALAK